MFSLAGVPPLLDKINFPAHVGIQLAGLGTLFEDAARVWGIYLNGEPALPADGCVTLDYRDGATITNAPQEQGKLVSYNKIAEPYQARLLLLKSGSAGDRAEFLDSLTKIITTLDLYDVVSPEHVYANANVISYEIRRTPEEGFELLQVEIVLQEVMFSPRIETKSTATTDGAKQENNGQVEAK